MAIEITAEDCEQVRKAIDIRLDDVTLPNETILLPIYAETALMWMNDHFTTDKPIPADQESKAKTAAIFYLASLLCPAIKQVSGEKIAGGERQYKPFDSAAKASELEARATGIIGKVIEVAFPVTSRIPTMFTLAKARR